MSPHSLQARSRASAVIPASLRLDRLEKRFGSRSVVRDFSLVIAAAEVVCLLGPSGCGKTTLLRLIAGIEEPTGGALLVDGRVFSEAGSVIPPERRGIGLVFQDYALFPQMTVEANVAFGLRTLPRPDALAVVHNALSRVGLIDRKDAYPYMLSGGEQQRVALARAIVPRPRIILMDEPFSNLDTRMRDLVREETAALLRETGATCVMVTHDPEEAMRIADRIVLMRDGGLVQVGTPEALYRAPVDIETARFFCDLNELPAQVREGRVVTAVFDMPAEGHAEGAATACIRPQGIRLMPAGQGPLARIRDVRFLGEVYLAELSVQGLDAPLRARLREKPDKFINKDASIKIDPEEVLVFTGHRA